MVFYFSVHSQNRLSVKFRFENPVIYQIWIFGSSYSVILHAHRRLIRKISPRRSRKGKSVGFEDRYPSSTREQVMRVEKKRAAICLVAVGRREMSIKETFLHRKQLFTTRERHTSKHSRWFQQVFLFCLHFCIRDQQHVQLSMSKDHELTGDDKKTNHLFSIVCFQSMIQVK